MLTTCDAVVDDVQAMHTNLLSSGLDVLQLVLSLDTHILNLADRLIDVRDLGLLCSLHTLCSNLHSKFFRTADHA